MKSKNRNDFCKIDILFLYNRLALTWNALPETIVKAPTLNSFKKQLEIVIRETVAIARPIPILSGVYGRFGQIY